MMSHASRLVTCLTLAGLGALVGCRGDLPEDDLPVEVRLETAPTPPIVGPTRLVISIDDSIGVPIPDAAVEVEGRMDHAGMAPVRGTADPADAGQYVVPEFDFTMGGDWILRIRITLPDGREAVRDRELRVVSGGPPDGQDG